MRFVLLLYGDESRWNDMSPEDSAESVKVWSPAAPRHRVRSPEPIGRDPR